MAREIAEMFRSEGIAAAAEKYANLAMRIPFKCKDPRGWAEFARLMSEHAAEGHALTMLNLQLKRPTVYELRPRLEKLTLPTLMIVGDEDESCLDPSIALYRMIKTSGCLVLPRSDHTINSEEPDLFNRALFEFFAAVEAGRWLAHRP